MFKKGRVFMYIALALVSVIFNFLSELNQDTLDEAFTETLIIFPMVLCFVFFTYKTRLLIINSNALKFIFSNNSTKNFFYIVLILLKALVVTLFSKLMAHLFFIEDEPDSTFFDIAFWTIFVSAIVFVGFVYLFENYIATTEQNHIIEIQLNQYEKEKSTSKYLSLKKQLNPHFLFNSFNSLISLISINPIIAEKFVEELSNIYRYNLSKSDDIVVPLSKELQMINSYIHLQKIRFGDAIIYNENIHQNKGKLLIPPMTLQLLVENAIKHNIVNSKSPLEITISNIGNYIVVKNNLQLKEKNNQQINSLGIGLKNLENQIKLISDLKVIIEQNKEHYTVFVPLIYNELDD
ncbi:sensor histidine kinase [Wenyingzhuangia sp. IMCC45574]